ncbi:hypothetical protein SAMN02745225_00652 [Ferrithrix thermotolerans DSM 19514]|uniref:ThiS family protein n=1 Tax=Ferrithrix thermotolerans DSM 19514 TaxID=1121881 RepID=A0A1M4TJY2_9ACTN|nr:hypothetical protein [Ferrithrix thermotolerans]SHE44770.1 hypothetical protein SAMN02745225_00652 [Ferrithrix thermotolerans DSM 19514]
MQVIVRIPAQLRSLTNGLGEVKVEFEGDLGTAFEQLFIEFPGLRERIMDDSGGLTRLSQFLPEFMSILWISRGVKVLSTGVL